MGWNTQAVISQLVIIEGPDDALLVYNGTPALGNLIGSWSASAGTDSFGNSYLAGLTVGSKTASNIRMDPTGGHVNMNNNAGLTTIRADAANEMIGWYPSGSGLGKLALSISSAQGSDASGNTIDAGIEMITLPLLMYDGTAATGHLIVSASPTSGTDAFGNAYPQGLSVTKGTISGTTFSGTDFIINSSGAFFYSSAPAAGNLIAAIAPASGTDSFGNHFFEGITAIPVTATDTPAITVGASNTGTQPALTFPSVTAGPAVPPQVTGLGTSNSPAQANLQVFSGLGANTNVASFINLFDNQAGFSGAKASVQVSTDKMQLVTASGGAGTPFFEVIAHSPSSAAHEVAVSGNTGYSMIISGDGTIGWGPGTGIADVNLDRLSAGVLEIVGALVLTAGNLTFGSTSAILDTDASGYPKITDNAGYSGHVSTGTPAAVNVNTVTAAAFSNLSVAQIPANDAEVGAVYRLTVYGYGTWGSTQQELDLACRFGAVPGAATDTVGTRAKIAALALNTSAGFQWCVTVIATCVTTGVSGTWQLSVSGSLSETTNPLNPGTPSTNSFALAGGTGNTAVTQDTTAAINLGLSAQWASTTGSPTISKTVGFFERVA